MPVLSRTRSGVLWLLVGLLVSGGITVAAGVAAAEGARTRSAPSAPPADPRPESSVRARVLLLSGSSLVTTSGEPSGYLQGPLGWRLADVPPLDGTWTSHGGTQPGQLLQVLRKRLDLATYDHVVVQGGELDGRVDAETLERAVFHAVDLLRAKARPDTSLTLIGPMPERHPGGKDLVQVNEALRAAARDRRVHFVDAVGAGWTAGSPRLAQELPEALRTALDL